MPKSHLEKFVSAQCFTPIQRNQQINKLCVDIDEAQDSASLKKLTITDMKEADVCFTFDIGGGDLAKYSPCLNTGVQQGHKLKFNKRCDFIIVRILGGNTYVYFGDLKSTSLRKQSIYRQMYASKLFFDYIKSIIEWEFPEFTALKNYIPRYVCCHDSQARLPRTPIRGTSQVRNNRQPEDSVHFCPVRVNAATNSATINFDSLSR
ncbi:TPA: hypothetical protein ACVO0S_002426 [Vibrio alginolyticus]